MKGLSVLGVAIAFCTYAKTKAQFGPTGCDICTNGTAMIFPDIVVDGQGFWPNETCQATFDIRGNIPTQFCPQVQEVAKVCCGESSETDPPAPLTTSENPSAAPSAAVLDMDPTEAPVEMSLAFTTSNSLLRLTALPLLLWLV